MQPSLGPMHIAPEQPEIHLPPFDDSFDNGSTKDSELQPGPPQQFAPPAIPKQNEAAIQLVPIETSSSNPDQRWQEFLAIQQQRGVTQVKAEIVAEESAPTVVVKQPTPAARSSSQWPEWMRPLRAPYVDRRKKTSK